MRYLGTTVEVIDALGGIAAVAELTGRKYTAAANWNVSDRFPANTYVILHHALHQRGLSAPPELWGMAREAAE